MQPGSGGCCFTMAGDANAARPDSAAATTRISHGLVLAENVIRAG